MFDRTIEMMSRNVYTIRKLEIADWADYRRLRLDALQKHPGVFLSTYARELTLDQAAWQQRLHPENAGVFGVFAGEDMVGLAAIIAEADRKTAQLVASYIREAHRGLGLSTMLYRARLEWFRERPEFEKLLVSHRASNDASRRAIQKFGFRMTGVIAGKVWPDGTIDDQIDHELTRAEIAAILRNITK